MTSFILGLMLSKTPTLPGHRPADLCYSNGQAVKCMQPVHRPIQRQIKGSFVRGK